MEHHIIAAYAQVAATVFIGLGQLLVIGWFLWQMQKYGKERDRVLDQQDEVLGELMAGLREQTRALSEESQTRRAESRAQSQALAELLRRPA